MRVTETSDKQHLREIRKALLENDGYCPCMRTKSPDTKCMCKDFRDKLDDPSYEGPCHCGLYIKTLDT